MGVRSATTRVPSSDQHGSSRDELFAARIHSQVQAFKSASAKEEQITFLGKDDLVDGEGFLHANHRNARGACNALPVAMTNPTSFFSRAAKALGLPIPAQLLLRADKVIE
jgi:hypothetical protein